VTSSTLSRSPKRPRWKLVAGAAAALAILALAESVQFYFQQDRYGRADTLSTIIGRMTAPWVVLAVLAPAVVWLAHIAPLDGRRGWVSLLTHAAASVAFALAHLTLLVAVHAVIDPPNPFPFAGQVAGLLRAYMFQDLIVYWGMIGALHALRYHHRALERAHEASALRDAVADARMQAIRAKLHPHFLFNTLNAVSMLVRSGDGARAVRILAELSDVLRDLLRDAPPTQIALRDEVAFTERLLALEQLRFGDRLRVVIDIDADVADARVPSLLLQPLVENAVRHGIAPVTRAGVIEVRGRRDGDSLRLEVRDNGAGVSRDWERGPRGIGLPSTVARLGHLYGSAFSFSLEPRADGGTASIVSLPLSLVSRMVQ